ncbi:Uncharacterised protein [Collinsella intestinalis]|nr:Uncharacterised protein [Collinsella intestinalis]
MISPPVEKSGMGMYSSRSQLGSSRKCMVAQQTSLRLKPQMSEAMATPMPLLADTRMLGNVVGSRRGSFMAPS